MVSKANVVDFIAEVSANHLGSFDRACKIVQAAAEAGATSVKFQTYTPDTMTLNLPNLQVSEDHALWGGRTLYELYQEAQTPWEWHKELFELSISLGLVPFSSPFDFSAVDFLEDLGVSKYKIASLESSDLPLIKYVAETGKPIIASTGATHWNEIVDLVETVNSTGNEDLTLLVCTSSYPAEPRDSHLLRIRKIKESFGVKVGLSDHTLGVGSSIAAIALGATVIEKHLTLRRADGGADSQFSMEPEEFRLLVNEGKVASEALGNEAWTMQPSEEESRRLRRSLYVVSDVKRGDAVSGQNMRSIRPGYGLSPKHYWGLLGKKFKEDYVAGTPINLEMFE
jgi:N-acetylneuraminate synthase